MKNERLLAVSCNGWASRGLNELIINFGPKDGHVFVGSIGHAKDVGSPVKDAKPSVALISPNVYNPGQLDELTHKLRQECEGIILVAVTDEKKPDWADHSVSYSARLKGENVIDFVTNLQH